SELPTMPAPIEPAAPPILYGTAWKRERTAALVERALTLGFRGVDTACQPKHYDEPGVGRGVAAFLARGGSRSRRDGQDPKRTPYDRSAPLAAQVEQSCRAGGEPVRRRFPQHHASWEPASREAFRAPAHGAVRL